ncbi:MAG: hypothetical protein APR63_09000 [Desulfuromonas sp. SDB]|nr:MAG: hypothetical protein APR63_09000 [Desulfuromonas sp. SDB]
MKKLMLILFLILSSGILLAGHFWDFEDTPWTDGWTTAKRDQGVNWPRRWDWQPYDLRYRRPPDQDAMSMWCSSYDAGSFVLRDTLISPAITDSVNFYKWFKWGVGYRYYSGRDYDTASVLIRTSVGGAWSNWNQLTFYFGSDVYGVYDSADISSQVYGTDSFQIAFAYRGGTPWGREYYVGIDNVSLSTELPDYPGPVLPPTGSDSCLTGLTYTYSSEAVAGNVEYQFYWGDGSLSGWFPTPDVDQVWAEPGSYFIRSRVRDALFPADSISDWSDSMLVIVVNHNTVRYWGFEVDDGGFANSRSRDWEWGIPESGPYSARSGYQLWGTDLDAPYDENASWLLSQPMDLSAADSAVLYYWMWYESTQDQDAVAIMVLTDSLPNGYDNMNAVTADQVFPPYTGTYFMSWWGTTDPGYTGMGDNWILYSVNLTPYLDMQDLQINWRLGVNSASGLDGFYVDDIRVDTFMNIPGPVVSPSGPDSGLVDTVYTYTSDVIPGTYQYQFDWGDGSVSNWSNSEMVSNSWATVGSYYIRSRVRDAADTTMVSTWSDPLLVKILRPQTVWYNGFEEDDGGYGVGTTGDWEWGLPLSGPLQARSGNLVWATDLDNIYNTNASWFLSPDINISYADSAVMYYWMWYESDWTVDGLGLFVGSESLASYSGTWSSSGKYWDTIPHDLVDPIYTGTFYMTWRSCNQGGYTGSEANWMLYSINLSPYASFEDLSILMRLADNNGTGGNGYGFYIDDIRVDTFLPPIVGPLTAPWGPTWGYVNTNYTFISDTASSGFGDLEYQFMWGDGSYSSWDTTRMDSHQFAGTGVYYIRSRARVISDTTLIGPWSPPHSIDIGLTGYFDPPWTFEPGLQGFLSTTYWNRESSLKHGNDWDLMDSDDWTLWCEGTGQVYVNDTTFSPQVGISGDEKYLIWTSCFRNSTSVLQDTAVILYKLYKNANWSDWDQAYMFTERSYPNWYYKDLPDLAGADSFQMAVIYIHRDGTSYDRFFGIDNIMLSNRPYITEIGWNFENNTNVDWTHTNGNLWPNGWQNRSSSTVSSLSLPSDGSYSMWIGNASSSTTPLVDTTFSPADWNPINVKYMRYGIGFNNNYDSIKVILSGYSVSGWSEWFELKTYYPLITPAFVGWDSVDVSAYAAYSKIDIGFCFYENTSSHGAAVIDNITLFSADETDALVAPPEPGNENIFAPAGNHEITSMVINSGTSTADFTVNAILVDMVTGDVILDESYNVTNLHYEDSLNINFGSVVLESDHIYQKKVLIDYPGDQNCHNDTAVSMIRCQSPQWVRLADIPTPVSGGCSWIDEDDYIHVYTDTLHYVYNPGTNTWSEDTPPPLELLSGNCTVANEQVFIVGEFRNQEEVMLIYDQSSDNYQTVELPEGMTSPTVISTTGWGNDYVYVIEGDLDHYPKCYLFDQNTQTFMIANPVPGGFSQGVASQIDGKILLAAGNNLGHHFYIGEVNPASPTLINWSTDYRSPVGRTNQAFGGGTGTFFLVAGGEKDGQYISSVYLYENERGWFTLPDFPEQKADATVIAMLKEQGYGISDLATFYVLGGKDSSGELKSLYCLSLDVAKPLGGQSEEQIVNSPYAFSVFLSSSNVFTDGVSINLTVPGHTRVNFYVYDLTGRKVSSMVQEMNAGIHQLRWNGTDHHGHQISAGTYFYVIETEYGSSSGKLMRVE